MKNRVIFGSVLLFAVVFGYWLTSWSFVEINVENYSETGLISYAIQPQESDVEPPKSIQEKTYRKLVRKGDFEVTVLQGNSSYFTVAEANGFFGTTYVKAVLTKEKSREFIGNNPKICMDYSNVVLVSWQCRSQVNTGVIHIPSTKTTPTYTAPIKQVEDNSIIEGLVTVEGSRLALVKAGGSHSLYRIDEPSNTLIGSSKVTLSETNGSDDYGITEFKNGFLVFKEEGGEYYFYPRLGQPAEKLNVPGPSLDELKLYGVQSFGDQLALTFNQHVTPEHRSNIELYQGNVVSSDVSEEVDEGEKAHQQPLDKTEVMIVSKDSSESIMLDFAALQVRLCRNMRLCVLHNQTVKVYDISSGSPKFDYQIDGATQIEQVVDRLLVVNEHGVLSLDPTTGEGFYEYAFGGFDFCGLNREDSSYALCVSAEGERRVLFIDSSKAVSSEIDKQLLELKKSPDIKTVSIYKNIVFIIPNVGEYEYNTQTGFFEHDPARVITTNESINQLLGSIELKSPPYTVVNPVR